MSINPETDLDLEKLFLPAWAQGSPAINQYAKFAGEDRPERVKDDGFVHYWLFWERAV